MSINYINEDTPLIPPVQNAVNPYEANNNQYLSYRHLHLIAPNRSAICGVDPLGNNLLCGCCRVEEIAYTALPPARNICFHSENYSSSEYCPIATLLIGGMSLVFGGFSTMIFAGTPQLAATSKLMLLASGTAFFDGIGACFAAKLSANCLNAKRQEDFDNFISELCQEAGGDEDARVRNEHIPYLFPMMHRALYGHMDFAQTEACYASPHLRNRLIENLVHFRFEINLIWQRVHEIHQLPSNEFINSWNNHYFLTNIRNNEDTYRAVVNYLPEHLQGDPAVRETIDRLSQTTALLDQEASTSGLSSLPQIPANEYQRRVVKQNEYYKFKINGKFFVIEKDFLAPFFNKVLVETPTRQMHATLDTTISVELNIPLEDHLSLDILLSFLQSTVIKIDDESINTMYKIAIKYDLERHLREKLCQVPSSLLFGLLTIAYTMDWQGLQMDVQLGILDAVNTASIETFDRTIRQLHLISICRFANELAIVKLQEILKDKFIESFKYIINKFKKSQFGVDLKSDLDLLVKYAKRVDVTLELLSEDETVTLQYELTNAVDAYMLKSTETLRILSTAVSEVSEMYLLKSVVLHVMRQSHFELMIRHAYAFGMHDSLYQLLYGPSSSR